MLDSRFVLSESYAISGFGSLVCPANNIGIGHSVKTWGVSHVGVNGRRTYEGRCNCGATQRRLQYARKVRK